MALTALLNETKSETPSELLCLATRKGIFHLNPYPTFNLDQERQIHKVSRRFYQGSKKPLIEIISCIASGDGKIFHVEKISNFRKETIQQNIHQMKLIL